VHLLQAERLGNHSRDVQGAFDRRRDDDGKVVQLGMPRPQIEELPAAHDGHHQVEENDVRAVNEHVREGLLTVRRSRDLVARVRQQLHEELSDFVVVVHHEHALGSRGRLRR
jgi:hypothetical protein